MISGESYNFEREVAINLGGSTPDKINLDSTDKNMQVNLDKRHYKLTFTSSDFNYKLVYFAEFILKMILVSWFLFLLIKLILSTKSKDVFSRLNVTRLRLLSLISFLFYLYDHFRLIFIDKYIKEKLVVSSEYYLEKSTNSAYQLPQDFFVYYDVDGGAILLALCLIVVSQVFKVGIDLKEDNEAII